VERREEIGDWEMDTLLGNKGRGRVVSLVERVTGCVLIGKLRSRTVAATNQRVIQPIRSHRHLFKTTTVDNGTESTATAISNELPGPTFYFATPYHSRERGTNENTNVSSPRSNR
jgi:IS30 family transposase